LLVQLVRILLRFYIIMGQISFKGFSK